MFANISSNYVKNLVLSTSHKNFTAMGRFNNRSADRIQRQLFPANQSFLEMEAMAFNFLKIKKY